MNTNPFLAAVVSTTMLLSSAVSAQTSPAAAADSIAIAPAGPPDQVIYAPRLPTVQELTDAAVARGVSIVRVTQSPSEVAATYQHPDGQVSTVAYALLPSASPAGSAVVVTTPPPPVVVRSTVIYRPSRRIVYYDPFLYDRWYSYPAVGIGIGVGLGHYYGHHHYRHHGHGRFHHRGRR